MNVSMYENGIENGFTTSLKFLLNVPFKMVARTLCGNFFLK